MYIADDDKMLQRVKTMITTKKAQPNKQKEKLVNIEQKRKASPSQNDFDIVSKPGCSYQHGGQTKIDHTGKTSNTVQNKTETTSVTLPEPQQYPKTHADVYLSKRIKKVIVQKFILYPSVKFYLTYKIPQMLDNNRNISLTMKYKHI